MSQIQSHKKRPMCLIESLPTDLLVAIMSTCYSLADLRAFIYASPILYDGFLSAKRTVLLEIVARDLGPGIREAVALALVGVLDPHREGFHHQAKHAIQRYAALPAGRMATRGITIDHVINIIRVNRAVQFFVGWFVSSRVAVMQKENTAASYPLGDLERHRISCAFIRYQLLMTVHPFDDWGEEKTILRMFYDLFQAWEMEQMTEAHGFLASFVGYANTFTRKLHANLKDLVELRQDILAEGAIKTPMERTIREYFENESSHRWCSFAFNWFSASHFFPTRAISQITPTIPAHLGIVEAQEIAKRDQLYARENEIPAITAGELTTDPPYGWVDALDGLNCCRWGDDLLRLAGTETPLCDKIEAGRKMNRWRWMGFIFWNKSRIELLKTQTSAFSEFHTGWLTNIWDDLKRLRLLEGPTPRPSNGYLGNI
ncbi:hypothetical protein HD806DRAFT_515443 [Xylariaceae sp. AK1471]|nr:hypothetical protein HD806DRAFT_515443 [Xylariaceae sp. AK1471]